MNPMISRLLLVALTVVAIDDARAAPVQPFSKALPQMCKTLQQQGWLAPADILNPGHLQQAEMSIPGVMYMCTLEHRLAGQGPGHKPDLQVLLSESGGDPSIIFSADVWCAADRAAALTALADQLAREIQAVGWSVPKETLDAVRTGTASKATATPLVFKTTPIEVDAHACERVADDALGAVLMKIDVKVEPASGAK
ncbi:MAG: hypothetical protein ABIQ70_10990 [Dokdonella sp.]